MRTAMVIAAREMREKVRLLVMCAAFAVIPFTIALLPSSRGHEPELIATGAAYLATALGLGIAVTLGGSTVVRDLAERRMSFYFTKPVGAASIWVGKAAASILVSIACFAVIAVPAMLATPKAWANQWRAVTMPVVWIISFMVVLFLVSHAMGTMVRSRSPLLGLDFVLLVVAAAALYLILRPLLVAMAVGALKTIALGVAAAVVLVLAVAPVWQLANGRSDIRRSHAALMRFLWPGIAIVQLLAGGVVMWVVGVEPGDVEVRSVRQPSGGPLMLVAGRAPRRGDYEAAFLIDRTAGHVRRLSGWSAWSAQLSDDGRVAVWMEPDGMFRISSFELHSTKGPSGITVTAAHSFELSADGRRIATMNGTLLAVYDLATGKLLGSAGGFDGRARHRMFFVSPDVVRVLEHRPSVEVAAPLRIFEYDLRARSLRKTGERMVAAPRDAISVSRGDGSTIFVRSAGLILDGRTAETTGTIPREDVASAAVLHDGTVAVVTQSGEGRLIRTYDRTGAHRAAAALPGADWAIIAGETDNGRLLVVGREGSFHPGRAPSGEPSMFVVDLAKGSVESKVDGVRGPMPQWSPDPRLDRYASGQDFAAVDREGRLVAWSLARPEPRPLLK